MAFFARFNILNRFLGRAPPKDCLDRLPTDVLVDIVFLELDILDILRLRQVSKLYYELTQHASIWKRLLRNTKMRLPPLPPTSRNTIASMSGLEAERLLIRAYSLERNWKTDSPTALREWTFNTNHRVLDMALLPGGQYLVASVTDRMETKYSLVVFAMDQLGSARAVAAMNVDTKAYSIQAKYMAVQKQESIVVAYIRRDYHHKTDRRRAEAGELQNANHYSAKHQIDSDEVKFRYECVVTHVPLDILEYLGDIPYPTDTAQFREAAAQLPRPFRLLTSVTSRSVLTCPVLAEMYGSPYIAVVKGTKDVIFKNLGMGAAATLTCADNPAMAQWEHSIKAIQLLPKDRSLFVVREVDRRIEHRHEPIYLFELYPALQSGPTKTSQLHTPDRHTHSETMGKHDRFFVPDFPSYTLASDILKPRDAAPKHSRFAPYTSPDPPLPICIFGIRAKTEALTRILFHARQQVIPNPPSPMSSEITSVFPGPLATIHHKYTLFDYDMLHWRTANPNMSIHVIPAYRSPLIYTTPWDDITENPFVADIRPFVDRGWEVPGIREVVDEVVQHPKRWVGANYFGGYSGPTGIDMHASAFAWDETIGRLVVAQEGETQVTVYDFAAAPRQDRSRQRFPIPLQMIPDPDVPMRPVPKPQPTSSTSRRQVIVGKRLRYHIPVWCV